ncbi:hypothetical protein ACJQWK_01852 [Exserohilum turcicum]
MIEVQSALEKACFAFTEKNVDDVLLKQAWDCAEAIELNQWLKLILEHQETFSQSNLADIKKALSSLLDPISKLRHAAVHRLRLPAKSALQLITDAEALARLLQENDSLKLISTTRQQLSVTVEDLEKKKRILDNTIAEIRKQFATKRTELEREEAALLEAAEKQSREGFFFTNASLGGKSDALTIKQES